MSRLVKKISKKAGLPPGTLVHTGEKKAEQVKITVIDYDEAHVEEKEAQSIEECFPFKDKPTVTWINIDGLHRVEIIKKLGDHFGLHPLVMEDILNTNQRPKMEDFGEYVYIVMQMLSHRGNTNDLSTEQISLIIGSNFVISFQETVGDIFGPIRERIRSGKGRIRKMASDYLAYALMDVIVDSYFIILEKMGEKVERLEDAVVINPAPETLRSLHSLKGEVIFLRKSVWPVREVISGLERGESSLIRKSTRVYLRDVYDHTIQVIEVTETLRDTLSSMLDIYLSSLSHRMNEVIKVLTIITTIFMPLTLITGVYGMNFASIPGLDWQWGYAAVLATMALIGTVMILYFRKKKWL